MTLNCLIGKNNIENLAILNFFTSLKITKFSIFNKLNN